MPNIENQPSTVVGYDQEIVVDGPDGVAVSLTPAAAIETGARLIKAGARALKQKRENQAGPE